MTAPRAPVPLAGLTAPAASGTGSGALDGAPVLSQGGPGAEPRISVPGTTKPGAAVAGKVAAAPGIHPIAAAMSEPELEQHMRRILADLPSVLAYHTHDSRRSVSGFPDWCAVGPGGVLFRELKREGKKPTPQQAAWLAALRGAGLSADVWRPSDLLSGRIARELAALAGLGGAG